MRIYKVFKIQLLTGIGPVTSALPMHMGLSIIIYESFMDLFSETGRIGISLYCPYSV